MSQDEIVHELNGLYAEEVEAAVRYLHLALTTRGLDRLVLRDFLLRGFQETVEHAQTVAEKIIQMGGAPSLNVNLKLPPDRVSGAEAIKTALAFEQAALDAYRDLLDKVEGDVVLENFVRSQVDVEAEHVSGLYQLLDD